MQCNEPQERDAVDDERAWQRALEYGEQRARAAGTRPEDVSASSTSTARSRSVAGESPALTPGGART